LRTATFSGQVQEKGRSRNSGNNQIPKYLAFRRVVHVYLLVRFSHLSLPREEGPDLRKQSAGSGLEVICIQEDRFRLYRNNSPTQKKGQDHGIYRIPKYKQTYPENPVIPSIGVICIILNAARYEARSYGKFGIGNPPNREWPKAYSFFVLNGGFQSEQS